MANLSTANPATIAKADALVAEARKRGVTGRLYRSHNVKLGVRVKFYGTPSFNAQQLAWLADNGFTRHGGGGYNRPGCTTYVK